MAVKVVKAGGQTTIDGQDIGKIRSVNLVDPRGRVLATDRSYVGQVAAAAEELQTTWQFHHLDGSLFTESETWKPQDFSFGGWQPAVMDSDYAATTRDKSLHQWNGVGRDDQYWSTFRSDYAHYLTNPSEMNGGLRTGFYLSAAVSSASLLVAGGLMLAGATATAGVSALATGGAIGVIVGGGTSAVQGRDVASGALVGAASGMVGGYASSLLSGSLGTSLVMQGLVGGAADGAVYEALHGGSLSDIAFSATVSGTLGAATGGLLRGAQQGIARYAKPLYSKALGTVFVAPSRLAGGLDDAWNLIPRNSGLPILKQSGPTCVANSCGMILEQLAPDRLLTRLEKYRGVASPSGVPLSEAASILNANGISATFRKMSGVCGLRLKVGVNKPAIVSLKTAEGRHAVVVDGFTRRWGKEVVSIRNPHGTEYYMDLKDFMKAYNGDTVFLN